MDPVEGRGLSESRRRSVLVTGASSGIGRATAEAFATLGDQVFGTSRRGGETIAAARTENGVTMLRLDVLDGESVQRCVSDVINETGGLDVLINNAGVMQLAMAEETMEDQANEIFETNFHGPVRVINAALPNMRQRRTGHIINVGSLAAWLGEPGEAFYAGSKAALARYTEALRHEVRHCGIQVSIVEPGVFSTPVLDHAITATRRFADYDHVRTAVPETLRRAMRGGGDPGRVASMITSIAGTTKPRCRYLAGRGARWIPALQVLLPQSLVEVLLRREYRLDQ